MKQNSRRVVLPAAEVATMAGTSGEQLLLEIDGAIAIVTLNAPERRNRLSKSLMEELLSRFQELAENTELRVVVLQAKGRDFSAGADLADPELADIVNADVATRRRFAQIGPRLVRAIQEVPQMTLVAMQGHCLGGAGCLALACDLRVAAADLVVNRGVSSMVVVPYLFFPGMILQRNVLGTMNRLEKIYPKIPMSVTPPLGVDQRLVDVAARRVHQAWLLAEKTG